MKMFTHKAALERQANPDHAIDLDARAEWAGKLFDTQEIYELDDKTRKETIKNLSLVHSKEYINSIHDPKGTYCLDPELLLNKELWEASIEAAASLFDVVQNSFNDSEESKIEFHLSRPGSHHAGPDYGMGFCLLNNLAYSARKAQKEGLAQKVAILDFDVHHGNGTEDIFSEDQTVMTASIHAAPLFPGTGFVSTETSINYPVPERSGLKNNAEWISGIEYLIDKIIEFDPDLILVEAGVDASEFDWSSELKIINNTFNYTGKRVASLANLLGVPLVVEIGGGYTEESFSNGFRSLLEGFSKPTGSSLVPPEHPSEITFPSDFITSVSSAFETIYSLDYYLYDVYPYTAFIGQDLLKDVNINSDLITFERLQIFQCWEAYKEENKDNEDLKDFIALADRGTVNQIIGYDFAKFMEKTYLDIFAEHLTKFLDSNTDSRFKVELSNTIIWYKNLSLVESS